jgi:MSHA pilin protein MshA
MKKAVLSQARTSGFTIVELVVVIALIGILSAVALPRFIDVGRDATLATMEGLVKALQTSTHLTHATAMIEGRHTLATDTLTVEGQTVAMVYGYPSGTVNGIPAMIKTMPQGWQQRASSISGAWVFWHGSIEQDAGAALCYVRYRQATSVSQPPVIDFQSSGC